MTYTFNICNMNIIFAIVTTIIISSSSGSRSSIN